MAQKVQEVTPEVVIKQVVDQLVLMSRIDFEIIKSVYFCYLELGMDDEEVSFLLGERNKYVFDLLDPTEKSKFKTEYLDYLPTILKSSMWELIADVPDLSGGVRLRASKFTYKSKIVYQFAELTDKNEEVNTLEWVKVVNTGKERILNPHVHEVVLNMYNNGGFHSPRSALDLFTKLEVVLGERSFSPSDLQKSLSVLMAEKSGLQYIKRVKIKGRYFYVVSSFVVKKAKKKPTAAKIQKR